MAFSGLDARSLSAHEPFLQLALVRSPRASARHVLVPGFILIWPVSEIGHRVDWFTDGHDADELALTLTGMHLKRCYNFTIRRHLCRNNLQPLDFPPPSCHLAPAISSLQTLIPHTKRFFWFSVSNLAIPQSMNRFGPPTLQFLRRTSP